MSRALLLSICSSLLLCALGCERRRASVGEVPCADDSRVLCEPHEAELLQLRSTFPHPLGAEGTAQVVWQHAIRTSPSCGAIDCGFPISAFLVHDDGEVTVAGVLRDDERDQHELSVTRLHGDGTPRFSTTIPDAVPALRDSTLTQLTLEPDGEDGALLLHGHGTGVDVEHSTGRLDGYGIARSGEIATRISLETGKTWPGPRALLDGDLVVARTRLAPNIEVARYAPHGQLRWRQTEVSKTPGSMELGYEVNAGKPELFQLAADRRGRVWGTLGEGLFGIVQLDPDGVVAWHAWSPVSFDRDFLHFAPQLAIDSRDRPVIGVGNFVLRLEPDGSDDERGRVLLADQAAQEAFYPPEVQGLDLDAQDRVYVGTQDGLRSMHRMVIDRLSEDFASRQRFAVLLAGNGQRIASLQLAPDGDVYIHVVADPPGSGDAGERIVRLHLSEP
jgi:hypothetical protein